MAKAGYFGPAFFDFFTELKSNNNRDWFQRNKHRYEAQVRGPMLRFISDFDPLLKKISRHYVADPRPVGGSMFRIYRDVRFSRDKRPYKTNAGAHFAHQQGRDVHAPGFYLHLDSDGVFMACGLWHPPNDVLTLIRDAIVRRPAAWQRAISAPSFAKTFTRGGASLVRPPKGYDPGHRFIEDLKRKDFTASARFDRGEAAPPGFLNTFAATCAAATPFMRFLTRAVGLPW